MVIRLFREYHDDYTKGRLETPFGVYYTIERPWKNNEPRVSAIPEGRYKVSKSSFWSGRNKGKKAFRLHSVPNRSGILIHIANFVKELNGCIGVGLSFGDARTISSTKAFNQLWKNLPKVFEIEVSEDASNNFLHWKDWEHLERKIISDVPFTPEKPLKVEKKAKKRGYLWFLLPLFLFFLKK